MAKTELVNPDVKMPGAESTTEQQLKKTVRLHWDNEPNSDFDCPYDGTYCRQKHMRVLRWREAVAYNAAHRVNQVFLTSANMFDKCPLEYSNDVQCIRRLRYENIMNKLNQNAK